MDNSCRVWLISFKLNCPTNYMSVQEGKTEMDIKDLWKRVLAELQITINPSSYNMFFGSTYPEKIENNEITLICLNGFVKENIEKKFFSLVQESVNRIGKGSFKISFIIKDRTKEQMEPAKVGPLFENISSINLFFNLKLFTMNFSFTKACENFLLRSCSTFGLLLNRNTLIKCLIKVLIRTSREQNISLTRVAYFFSRQSCLR